MNYRREIDGLRALAVVPVILFHAGFGAFSGGFVGVDVFFVISGYLITSIILAEKDAGSFSLLKFYERRARRILPALFLVMAASLPFAWLFLLPNDLKEFAFSLAAVPLFVSNILFWSESGYFQPTAEWKPLLHTWSLAVEEQYYILFPLLLLLTWRLGKRWIVGVLAAGAVISLATAQWGAFNKPDATFFLLPTRAWELAIGAITAFYLSRQRAVVTSNVASQLASGAGLLLILYAVFAFNRNTPFPSLYALVPTVGTALIILFAAPANLVGRVLGTKALVGIGLISYSAYLWHQPLFAFARQRSLAELDTAALLLLSMSAFVLAYFSWRLVERPFRQRGVISRRSVLVFAASVSALFIGVGLLGIWTNGFERHYVANRLTPRQQALFPFLSYNKSDEFVSGTQYGRCLYGSRSNSFESFKKDECLRISDQKKNYLLVGDSHAAHYWFGLSRVFPDVNVMQASATVCRPLVDAKGLKPCTDLMRFIFTDYVVNNRLDGVILAGRWLREDLEAVVSTAAYLAKRVPTVIVLGPTVEYRAFLPWLLIKAEGSLPSGAGRLDRFTVKDRFDVSRLMRDRFANERTTFVPVIDAICPGNECSPLAGDGAPVMWDNAHLTASGSALIIERLKEAGLLRLD